MTSEQHKGNRLLKLASRLLPPFLPEWKASALNIAII